ncbi:type IV CRISPR-associated endonuclease Csf5 [Paraburkholderia youngii]|uniref:type IV CRISPR-associated endonuclease Csf5 n=1 Tax=Paraburkholderia youngii TaxID=2782701 RepID=UPI003D248D23
MTKQTLLRIRLPEGERLYVSDFREAMAKQVGIQPELFHYGDNGKPAPGIPHVHFVGGKSWVGILADEERTPLLYDVMGSAVRAAQALTGKLLPAGIEEITLGLRLQHWPTRYFVREMAIKRRTKKSRESGFDELVKDRLTKSLARQAQEYGIHLPSEEQLAIEVSVIRPRGLRLSTTSGLTREYVMLTDVSFTIHAKLTGIWQAGSLTARGYGRIGRDLSDLAIHLKAEAQSPRRNVQ